MEKLPSNVVHLPITHKYIENNDLPPKTSKTQFSCLVLSPKGLDRAFETGIKNIDFSISSSESYSLKNTQMSTKEALVSLRNMIKNAKGSNINVRAGIQCVWGCVYDGRPNQKNLMKLIIK